LSDNLISLDSGHTQDRPQQPIFAMQTVRRLKIRDQAAEQIKQYIVARRLGPGDRLPTETQLAEAFGISRLSVREATKALEFLGIVESKTGVGLNVGAMDIGRVSKHLGFHHGLLHADPHELIDSRVILETGVLAHVARNMAADRTIEQTLQAMVGRFRAARVLKTWIELDIQFHHTLLEASGLQPLVAFGGLLHVFFRRFRESVKEAEWQAGIDSHQRLVDLLAGGQVTDAIAELRQHIESHRERI
jgi:GntR family transcriptional regulator, transcriptional repressor for pyruvate dehydrogenase complex